jgi:hypothetical protein
MKFFSRKHTGHPCTHKRSPPFQLSLSETSRCTEEGCPCSVAFTSRRCPAAGRIFLVVVARIYSENLGDLDRSRSGLTGRFAACFCAGAVEIHIFGRYLLVSSFHLMSMLHLSFATGLVGDPWLRPASVLHSNLRDFIYNPSGRDPRNLPPANVVN